MRTKIIDFSLLIVILIISGCVDSPPSLRQTPNIEETNDMKYVGTFDGIYLYQFRLESVNATCIGGAGGIGYSRVDVLDCKYDKEQ